MEQQTLHAQSESSGAGVPTSSGAPSSSSSSTSVPAASSTSSAPSSLPAPSAPDNDDDEVIPDGINEDDIMDVKDEDERKSRKSKAAPPADAGSSLDKLNELLKNTEQFAKFISSQPAKKQSNRGRSGRLDADENEKAEDEELVKDELENDGMAVIDHLDEQPPSVNKINGNGMRDYQLEALNWLIKLHDQKLNGILADEMGLGKTLESLSLLSYLKAFRNYAGPHLIIVPKSTSSNWLREVKRWTNNLTAFKFHGNAEERELLKPNVYTHDVTVTTYEMVILEKSFFKKPHWHYIYIDEAHRIKNENSLLARVVRSFTSDHRLLITGTPLQNNLHELWALLNFLVPQLFHSAEDFQSWFDFSDPSQRAEIVQRLHRLLRPFLLRRLKSDVERTLPPKIETKLYVGMSQMQKQWYTKILERDIYVLNSNSNSKMRLLNIVMQLRKVTNHPYLFHGAEPGPPYLEGEHIVENSGKMVLLDKLLKKLYATGHRVLIFSQMGRILDILEDYLRYRNYNYCRIDGQTKQEERDDAMEEFNAPNSKKFVFILSTRAGGLGINLQTADTVILYDSDWNPQMDLQAMDRAHRIGQRNQVNVYRFVTEHTIEQKMVERATKKLFLSAIAIKEGRLMDTDQSVSAQELQDMVRFGASRIFQNSDATITDEDIDVILSRGAEKTKAEHEKLKENAMPGLLDFNMNLGEGNFQEFEGKDYSGFRHQVGFEFIEPPKRERKAPIDINAYYREALRIGDAEKAKKARAPKEFKPTVRYDFQFFDVPRLEELEKKDWDAKQKLITLQFAKKQKELEERRAERVIAKEARLKARYQAKKAARLAALEAAKLANPETQTTEADAEVSESSDDEEDEKDEDEDEKMTDTKDEQSRASTPFKKESTSMEIDHTATSTTPSTQTSPSKTDEAAKVEQRKSMRARTPVKKEEIATTTTTTKPATVNEVEEQNEEEDAELKALAGWLSPEEQVEKDRLTNAGFATWNRRHLLSFVRACERWGRADRENIRVSVEEKTPEEVDAYYDTFFKKYEQIKDGEKLLKQIERGEARLEKLKSLQMTIDTKVKRHKRPYDTMHIPYASNQQRTFTEEEDKFIILTLHRVGYGQWEELKNEIRNSWMFRFDWFLKSRTCAELAKRVEYLIKILEKENEEVAEKKKQALKLAKAKERAKALFTGGGSAKKASSSSLSTPKKKGDDSKSSSSSSKKHSESSKKSDSKKKSESSKKKESSKKSDSAKKSDSSKKSSSDKKRKESASEETPSKSKKQKVSKD